MPTKFYCYYEYDSPKLERLLAVSHTGPWTEEQHKATLARHASVKALPVAKGLACPDLGISACAAGVRAFTRPLQDLLGWKRPDYPTPEEVAGRTAARVARPRGLPVAAPPRVPGEVLPPPPYQLPPASQLYCLKNSAFNYVDCYLKADNALVWSNWQHGAWAGTAAPPGAPYGAGIGA